MEKTLIQLKDICKVYNPGENEVRALDHINLEIMEGELVAIIGQSGSGKSTLMNMLGCLDVPTSGSYYLHGQDVSHLKDNELSAIRNKEIGFIFQGFNLIANLNAVENVELPLIYRGIGKQERRKLAKEALEMVGLGHRMDHKPSEMSGGQQQRVGIARALAVNPEFIVCDEPISALDVSIQAQVINMFEDLQEQMGLTYLFIAHDLSAVKHISNRIGVMYLGRMVELADSYELIQRPLHPYTKSLISAIPIADPNKAKESRRIVLEGDVPSPLNPPSGCRFRTRCPYADETCAAKVPEWKEIEKGHFAACHHIDKCN